jgi:hypothetical protein
MGIPSVDRYFLHIKAVPALTPPRAIERIQGY